MSNNIYNILNNFNKLTQDAPSAPAATPKAKTQLQESMEQVVNEKYMGFKKTVAAVKAGGAKNPEAVAAAIGRKKYGKEKFQKAAAAGKKLNEKAANPYAVGMAVAKKKAGITATPAHDLPKKVVKKAHEIAKKIDETQDPEQGVAEANIQPTSAASRSHIGNLSNPVTNSVVHPSSGKEIGLITQQPSGEYYAQPTSTALANSQGGTFATKDEAHQFIRNAHAKAIKNGTLSDKWLKKQPLPQFAKGQDVAEARFPTVADAQKRAEQEKGTGKFTSTKSPNHPSGTIYTRKYNPKSGESDDTENVTAVTRGRGRPKKSAFESISTIDKMIAEAFDELFENPTTAPVQPKDAAKFMASSDPKMFDKLAGKNAPAAPAPKAGTITKGVWTADAPKPGQAPVPVPQGLDEVDAEMEGMRKLAGLKGGQKRLDKDHDGKLTATDFAMLRKGVEEAESAVDEQLNPALSTPTLDKIVANKAAAVKRGDASAQADYDKAFSGAYSRDEQGQKKYSNRTAPGVINKIKDTFGWDKPDPAYGPKPAAPAQSTNEADMEEGNAFSGAVARAKADGVQPGEKIKVGGKEYDLKEGDDALNQMRKIAGLKECGMSPISSGASDMREEEGQMNISTNQSSDGTKSVTISASGDAASSLMQILKLAGLGGQSHEAEPQGVMVVSTDGDEEVDENLVPVPNPSGASSAADAKRLGSMMPAPAGEKDPIADGDEEVDENLVPVPNPSGASSAADAKRLGSMMPAPAGEKDPIATKEAKDERYHASTTPDEQVAPVQALTKGGNGDVAGQEKKMKSGGYQFGDNNHAMQESLSLRLMKEYNSIKVKK